MDTRDAGRSEQVTAGVASALGQVVRERVSAAPEQERESERERITKLILECVFAMFAEDTGLMPPRVFTDALREADRTGRMDPVWSLFDDLERRAARDRGDAFVPCVNGPLFERKHPEIQLSPRHIHALYRAANELDWKDVRPEIFGSIFERALDETERHELGAHFTREADIVRVVGPTIVEPWRTRIQAVKTAKDIARVIEEMKSFHVLDPACGCGNFLYVVYREMKRLEATLADHWTRAQRAAAKREADMRPPPPRPYFTLSQLHGIEKKALAAFLSRVVLWMGEHLAKREMGLVEDTLPLEDLEKNICHGDALVMDWPRPAGELAIVGNPPYLGVRKMRREFGDTYVEELFERFPDNRAADYVTYWFTRAVEVLKPGERAGYVCTNSVAQNEGREASIDKIVAGGGTITDAWKSYPWPGEAAVHIGIVNWIMAPHEGKKTLDGREVRTIAPSLTETIDLTAVSKIDGNKGLCFMGVTPGNHDFILTEEQRDEIIRRDPRSAEVIKPFLIGRDVNREIDQGATRWIIDFGAMEQDEAEQFAGAMRHVREYVYPVRKENRREAYARRWWRFVEARPGLREALRGTKNVLVLPRVSPHLIVCREKSDTCFDGQLMVVALGGYYDLGILQSRIHETWAWTRGSTLKGDLRYTNTTIFETLPFPLHPRGKYDPRERPPTEEAERVADAAEAFDELRAAACRERGLGLTKIHNQLEAGDLPELGRARDALNDAVAVCYGFPKDVWRSEGETLSLLLEQHHRITAL